MFKSIIWNIRKKFFPEDSTPVLLGFPEGTEVGIHYNDELGEDYFSVYLLSDPCYWIDSFDTLYGALNFIERNKYKYDPSNFYDTRLQAQI